MELRTFTHCTGAVTRIAQTKAWDDDDQRDNYNNDNIACEQIECEQRPNNQREKQGYNTLKTIWLITFISNENTRICDNKLIGCIHTHEVSKTPLLQTTTNV